MKFTKQNTQDRNTFVFDAKKEKHLTDLFNQFMQIMNATYRKAHGTSTH